MTTAEQLFKNELEIFRTESEAAAQFFYGYLAIHEVARSHKSVSELLNEDGLFWKITLGALQTAAFITLGRIFDDNSPHNVNKVLKIAQDDPAIFSRSSLGLRKRGRLPTPPAWLQEFLKDAHEPTVKDLRRLGSLCRKYRKIYEKNYHQFRNKVFAHKDASDSSEVARLVAKTDIRELQRLIVFLLRLHETLEALFINGSKPVLRPAQYSIRRIMTKATPATRSSAVHERISAAAKRALLQAAAQHAAGVER